MTKYDQVLQKIAGERGTWLVTGVAGFIGSHLLESLLMLNQRVVGLDNFSTGSEENLVLVRASVGEERWKRFKFIEGDVRSLEACRKACAGVERVLHQAALGSVPRSVDDPIASNENNISGFLNMLVAARDAGVTRFVYAASSAVYGDDLRLPKIEAHIGRPLSPYAVTKYVNELYAEVFARNYGFNSIGLRYFNVFGPRQRANGEYPAVIPAWIAALIGKQDVYINGDGKTARDFCYVDNAVQANLLAACTEDKAALNQIYNVALNAQTSLKELFDILRTLIAPHYPDVQTVQPIYRDARRGDMRFSRADISKASRFLGYHPVCRVRQGLEKTVDWYVGNLEMPMPDKRRRPASSTDSEDSAMVDVACWSNYPPVEPAGVMVRGAQGVNAG
jgi:UDP-N-acetylglucosamine 4-epimerase